MRFLGTRKKKYVFLDWLTNAKIYFPAKNVVIKGIADCKYRILPDYVVEIEQGGDWTPAEQITGYSAASKSSKMKTKKKKQRKKKKTVPISQASDAGEHLEAKNDQHDSQNQKRKKQQKRRVKIVEQEKKKVISTPVADQAVKQVYEDLGTIGATAEKLGISYSSARSQLIALGVKPSRGRPAKNITDEEIVAAFNKLGTVGAVAAELGLGYVCARSQILKAGIKLSRGRPKKKIPTRV